MDITVPNKVKDTSIEQNFQSLIDQLNDKIESLESELSQVKNTGLWIPAISAPVVVKSTVTSFTVGSGLSLDTDKEWLLTIRLLLSATTGQTLRVGPRGAMSSGNYNGRLNQNGTYTNQSDLRFASGISSAFTIANFDLFLSKRTGRKTTMRGQGELVRGGTGSFAGNLFWGADNATSDIPSLDVDSTTGSILANSEAMLYKRVG